MDSKVELRLHLVHDELMNSEMGNRCEKITKKRMSLFVMRQTAVAFSSPCLCYHSERATNSQTAAADAPAITADHTIH